MMMMMMWVCPWICSSVPLKIVRCTSIKDQNVIIPTAGMPDVPRVAHFLIFNIFTQQFVYLELTSMRL